MRWFFCDFFLGILDKFSDYCEQWKMLKDIWLFAYQFPDKCLCWLIGKQKNWRCQSQLLCSPTIVLFLYSFLLSFFHKAKKFARKLKFSDRQSNWGGVFYVNFFEEFWLNLWINVYNEKMLEVIWLLVCRFPKGMFLSANRKTNKLKLWQSQILCSHINFVFFFPFFIF